MNLSIHNIEQFKWKIPMKTRFQMSQNGTRPKFCLHHFRRISAKRPIMRFKISLVEKCLIFPLHVPLTNLPFVQHFISLVIFLFRMTSRVFLDRVQATPDKKDQLTKESASSPCPERTIKLSGKPIPQEVLDDLCARFLLNIPESGMSDHHFLDLHTIALKPLN